MVSELRNRALPGFCYCREQEQDRGGGGHRETAQWQPVVSPPVEQDRLLATCGNWWPEQKEPE